MTASERRHLVTDQVLDGFKRHFRQSPATDPWEPLWSKASGGGFTLALHVADAHCNARGLLHGGIISALADNAMGLSCVMASDNAFSLVTVSLSLDFLGMAKVGAWLEFVAKPTKIGRTMCFASVEAIADGKIIARATGVFQIVPRHKSLLEGSTDE
jgi:uncharacterized protein (TIGR00369 family)